MEVLVTGATGFVGHAVVGRLLSCGHRVRVLVRPSSDQSLLAGLELDRRSGDITDRGSIVTAARGVEAIIHTAAYVSLYSKRIEEMRRVNTFGADYVASAALEVGVRRVVHVSSLVAVGPSRDGTPVDEGLDWPFGDCPVPYLLTKREAEQITLSYARPDMDVVVVNPCLVVGAPDPRGVDPGDILRFLRREIPLVLAGGANFVGLTDVASGIVAALERGRSGERYLLGGENLSLDRYYALLEELSGVKRPRVKLPHSLVYAAVAGLEGMGLSGMLSASVSSQLVWMAQWTWYADSSKARSELGYSCTPIRQSLVDAIEYYRRHKMV